MSKLTHRNVAHAILRAACSECSQAGSAHFEHSLTHAPLQTRLVHILSSCINLFALHHGQTVLSCALNGNRHKCGSQKNMSACMQLEITVHETIALARDQSHWVNMFQQSSAGCMGQLQGGQESHLTEEGTSLIYPPPQSICCSCLTENCIQGVRVNCRSTASPVESDSPQRSGNIMRPSSGLGRRNALEVPDLSLRC